jgi:hypothetical protein
MPNVESRKKPECENDATKSHLLQPFGFRHSFVIRDLSFVISRDFLLANLRRNH